jgi:hypothetical protein
MLVIFYMIFCPLPSVRRSECFSDKTLTIILSVPLTDHLTDPDEIGHQATEFLSSFSDTTGMVLCSRPFIYLITDLTAVWKVNAESIPVRQGQLIMGMTPRARDESVVWRFLRFRFPLVRFEWQVETPHAVLNDLTTNEKETVEIKVMWKAWARFPVSSGGFIIFVYNLDFKLS